MYTITITCATWLPWHSSLQNSSALKHLRNVKLRLGCPQTFLWSDSQCKGDVSETLLDVSRLKRGSATCWPQIIHATRHVQAFRCWYKPGLARKSCVVDVVVLWTCSGTACALPNPDQVARSACHTDQLAKPRSACQTQISLPDLDQLAQPRSACRPTEEVYLCLQILQHFTCHHNKGSSEPKGKSS